MKKVIVFLQENKSGVLATSENNKPHARPQHVHLIKDGKFYFTTANVKKAYAQLKENPYIEFVVTTEDFTIVRISGEIKFTNNIEEKQMVLEHAPLVKKGYQTADNPLLEVFYLEHGKASFTKLMTGDPAETFIF
ncbi:MAG: pyridoxamine 5'-phosphate oxidase family protein [Marinisporobacter sp.]|nr:pyridoxamine 5'-phosphate oxidase family protein [Marinisporobacter sp.]